MQQLILLTKDTRATQQRAGEPNSRKEALFGSAVNGDTAALKELLLMAAATKSAKQHTPLVTALPTSRA